MRGAWLLGLLLYGFAVPAWAVLEEIPPLKDEKALPTRGEHYWWPKVDAPAGWHRDVQASYIYGMQVFVPNSSEGLKSDSFIYAKADRKKSVPQVHSLQEFIAEDQKEILVQRPDVKIEKQAVIQSGDGHAFTVYSFTPPLEGSWEWVAYGEEGDFYTLFTLTSTNQYEFKKYLEPYKGLIASYSYGK